MNKANQGRSRLFGIVPLSTLLRLPVLLYLFPFSRSGFLEFIGKGDMGTWSLSTLCFG